MLSQRAGEGDLPDLCSREDPSPASHQLWLSPASADEAKVLPWSFFLSLLIPFP